MNLTRLKERPSLYNIPLDPLLLASHEEIEILLESYLTDYNSLETKLGIIIIIIIIIMTITIIIIIIIIVVIIIIIIIIFIFIIIIIITTVYLKTQMQNAEELVNIRH